MGFYYGRIIRKKNRFKKKYTDCSNWFYWISALSIINTFVIIFGAKFSFIFGLGITQLIDAFSLSPEGVYSSSGLFLNIGLSSCFAVFGYFANKKNKIMFIIGIILYALDGLIMLLFEDFFGFGFHLFAIFIMIKGILSIKKINDIENRLENIKSENPIII